MVFRASARVKFVLASKSKAKSRHIANAIGDPCWTQYSTLPLNPPGRLVGFDLDPNNRDGSSICIS